MLQFPLSLLIKRPSILRLHSTRPSPSTKSSSSPSPSSSSSPRLTALRSTLLSASSVTFTDFSKNSTTTTITTSKSGQGCDPSPSINSNEVNNSPSLIDWRSLLPLPLPLSSKPTNPQQSQSQKSLGLITDTHNRTHNYLRLSLSERCNLRCLYCMPENGVPLTSQTNLLTDDEMLRIARVFMSTTKDAEGRQTGKIRLTGGEPLLHKSLPSLIQSINLLNPTSIGITTNALTLSRTVNALVENGLTNVNISLDSITEQGFRNLTRRKGLHLVLNGIEATVKAFNAADANKTFKGKRQGRLKINTVVMRGLNSDSISDFINLQRKHEGQFDVRFIEWMPFNSNDWAVDTFVSYTEMIKTLEKHENKRLVNVGNSVNDTTKWYKFEGTEDDASLGRIGFITSMSSNFCSTCNRVRVTADGSLKVCLFDGSEISLRDAMRDKEWRGDLGFVGVSDLELEMLIRGGVKRKEKTLGGYVDMEDIKKGEMRNRNMSLIGG